MSQESIFVWVIWYSAKLQTIESLNGQLILEQSHVQFTPLKKGCDLISSTPLTPEPFDKKKKKRLPQYATNNG